MPPRTAGVSGPAGGAGPVVTIGPTPVLLAAVRRLVQGAATAAQRAGRPFRLAVSGGAVATQLLPGLTPADADWSATELWWVDERAVPPESPDSNAGEAARGWLRTTGARAARPHPMSGAPPDPVAAAHAHDAALRTALGDDGRIDLAILGTGEDGHVCSLFPGHAAFEAPTAWVMCEMHSPKPPPVRLTWTLPVFARVTTLCVAVLGAGKAGAMQQAQQELAAGAPRLPVARLLHTVADAHWLLDPAAASAMRLP